MTSSSLRISIAAVFLLGIAVSEADITAAEPSAYPRSIPLPAGCKEPAYRRLQATAADGKRLTIHEWAPPDKVAGNPVVLFIHGIGMHGEPYASVAGGFTSRGIILAVPDLRGHGRSEGERGELAEAAVLRSDIDRMIDLVSQQHAKSPIFLLGDSMGGLIAAEYARFGQKRLAGLILMVPGFGVHISRLQVLPDIRGFISNGRICIDNKDNLVASSREPGFVKAKMADPLATHDVKPIYLARIAGMGVQWPWVAEALKLPTYFCIAGEDRVINNELTRRVYSRVATPKEKKVWRVWDGAYHTLCWDPETPKVVEELCVWVLGLGLGK